MASEARSDPGRLPKRVPLLGSLLGFVAVFHGIWVTWAGVLELEFVRQFPFLWQIPLLLGALVGGGIGGIIQLATQGRTAEIPRYLFLLLRVALWFIFLFPAMFLGDRLGERLYGRAGAWIGSMGCGFLMLFGRLWLERRSLRDKPPAPPPASA